MRWRPQDLAAWVDSKRPPLRNGVFQTCAMLCGPISYRRCTNGVWFQPRDTADEAAACEQVAVDAPHWWRGLVRNCAPVVLRMVAR